jgi:hypothetical protein
MTTTPDRLALAACPMQTLRRCTEPCDNCRQTAAAVTGALCLVLLEHGNDTTNAAAEWISHHALP